MSRRKSPDGRAAAGEPVARPARTSRGPRPVRPLAPVRTVLAAVHRSLDPEIAVRAALEAVVSATGATHGSVWLLDERGRVGRVAHVGLTREYLDAHAALGREGEIIQVELTMTPDVLFVDDIRETVVSPAHRDAAAMLGVRSWVILPLDARGRRIGSINLSHPEPGWFSRLDRDELGAIADVVAMALDNARLFVEARAAAARWSDLVRTAAEGIIQLDLEGRFVELNPAYERIVGYARDELIGRSSFMLSPPELHEESREQLVKLLETGELRDLRTLALHRDGTRVPVSVSAALVRDPAGRPTGIVVQLRDERDRLRFEAQLLHAQKLEAVGTLAGGVAHDFNNLLTAVLGNVSLALYDLPAGHPAEPILRDAERAALRAADLTRRLLSFSRRAPIEMRPLDVNEQVAEVLELLAPSFATGIEVVRRLAPEPWRVEADAPQIGQVLMNVCVNAADAMPEGGTLEVSTGNVRLRSVEPGRPAAARAGAFVRIEVRDTGVGMSSEVLARAFDPFFTTKGPDRGTGLGLAVAHGILQQHHGWIEVESLPGRGTAVALYLPAAPGVALAAGEGGREPASRGTVLVVDDEPVVRELARSMLEREGHRVLLAEDGERALAIHATQRGAIDAVLLDLTMPRMSGTEVLEELRRVDPHVPVLVSTGYALDSERARLEALGVAAFVGKPYRAADLAAAIRSAMAPSS